MRLTPAVAVLAAFVGQAHAGPIAYAACLAGKISYAATIRIDSSPLQHVAVRLPPAIPLLASSSASSFLLLFLPPSLRATRLWLLALPLVFHHFLARPLEARCHCAFFSVNFVLSALMRTRITLHKSQSFNRLL